MAILQILHYPDPRLHTVAKPVVFTPDSTLRLQTFLDDMVETMYDAKGIGLAASQVNVHERIVVIDVSEERNDPLVLINPRITWVSPERQKGEEGCLSVPGVYDGIERSLSVRVTAADARGVVREIEAEGLLAVCVQHELDHLEGKVFVEYLSPLKRNRIKTKMLKEEREARR